jgi:hypothetical protein
MTGRPAIFSGTPAWVVAAIIAGLLFLMVE